MAFGVLKGKDLHKHLDVNSHAEFWLKVEIPSMLSFLAYGDPNSYVAGIKDLIMGNEEHGIMPYREKIRRGYEAQQMLSAYKEAQKTDPNGEEFQLLQAKFRDQDFIDNYFRYFGYGSFYDPIRFSLRKTPLKWCLPFPSPFMLFT